MNLDKELVQYENRSLKSNGIYTYYTWEVLIILNKRFR